MSGVNSSKISLWASEFHRRPSFRLSFAPTVLLLCGSVHPRTSRNPAEWLFLNRSGARAAAILRKSAFGRRTSEFSGVSVDYRQLCCDRLETLCLFLSRYELCACGVAPSESVRGVGSVNSSKISLRTSEFERRLSFVLSCAPMVWPLGGYVYRPAWRLPAAWHLVNRFRA